MLRISHFNRSAARREAGSRDRSRGFRRCFLPVVLLLSAVSPLVSCSGGDVSAHPTADGRIRLSVERRLMATLFRIDVIVEDEIMGREAVEAAFAEIASAEGILSNWGESSQISEINRSAGVQPVVVSHELMEVLQRAHEVAELTNGAFDISFASCGGLWSIRDRRIPSDEELARCLDHVDYRKVALDPTLSAVYVSDPETRVGIAGLAKGYRVDRAARILEGRGITDYVVDGGGDMRVSSAGTDDSWKIKVAHPRRPGEPAGHRRPHFGGHRHLGRLRVVLRGGRRPLPPHSRSSDRPSGAEVRLGDGHRRQRRGRRCSGDWSFCHGALRGARPGRAASGSRGDADRADLSVHTTTGFPDHGCPRDGQFMKLPDADSLISTHRSRTKRTLT